MQETNLQDDSIRELADTLCEMLATANTADVIVDISCQSLWVVLLIHEYMKLSLAGDSLLYLVKLQF